MHLTATFLAPYYAKGDVFPDLLARCVYLSKYKRPEDTCWTDTIKRVVEGNCSLDLHVTQAEAEALFDTMYHGRGLAAGRGLYSGGVVGMPPESAYNCLKGTTQFWSNGELKTLAEMCGQRTTVLTSDGRWLDASVQSFGQQQLYRINFKPCNNGKTAFRLSYEATKNHRWVTTKGITNTLAVGDRVLIQPNQFPPTSTPFQMGYVHGIIYGDGCETTGAPKNYQIRLCGEKKTKFLDYLLESPYYVSHSYPPSYKGDPHVRLKTNKPLKALPADEDLLAYQAGFLKGWLDTDGFTMGMSRGLEVTDSIGAAWVEERAPLLGYCITGKCNGSTGDTNFGPRKTTPTRLTMVNRPMEYQVDEILPTSLEEVFCVVEPETETFTLCGGMPTGNCHGTNLTCITDFGFVANMLMCGGGVGVSLLNIQKLPQIIAGKTSFNVCLVQTHPDYMEVMPSTNGDMYGPWPDWAYVVQDSRLGWVGALEYTLRRAFDGTPAAVDVTPVRPRGSKIKTFGGTACGPGPLVKMLRSVWRIVRGAQGRTLNSVECLDIINHIGLCIKSGNVRRSALLTLGDPFDHAFRQAKQDHQAVLSHRHTSNNSLGFTSPEQMADFNWVGFLEDNRQYGDPGFMNFTKVWETDPGVVVCNPCAEAMLHHREACCLAEVFPALHTSSTQLQQTLILITRYTLRQRLLPHTDPQAEAARVRNMRIGVGLGGVCDKNLRGPNVRNWRHTVQLTAANYAQALGVAKPIATTVIKPSGTISKLNGSSPGAHATHAPFYLQRIRLDKDEPMATALAEAGIEQEVCQYDNTGRTLVFAFPMAAKPGAITTQTDTFTEQLERQYQLQNNWANQAVSATITFDPDRIDVQAPTLAAYAQSLKTCSFLARTHAYPQAPYEQISEKTYSVLCGRVNRNHPLTAEGTPDAVALDGCEASGFCPSK